MQRPVGQVMPVLAAALVTMLAVASCSSPGPAQRAAAGQPRESGQPPASSGTPSASGRTAPGALGGSSPPGVPASPAAASPPAPSGGPSLRLPPSPRPGCDASRWLTRPVSVARAVRTPPVPVVTAIRMGTHPDCGYDRIVLNLRGRVPGYEIKYVTKAVAGPAARAAAARGDRYLLITLHPAQGHRQSGASTISPAADAADFPVLRGYAVASDFEGALCIVVIVAKATAFRVGTLSRRLYVDVAG